MASFQNVKSYIKKIRIDLSQYIPEGFVVVREPTIAMMTELQVIGQEGKPSKVMEWYRDAFIELIIEHNFEDEDKKKPVSNKELVEYFFQSTEIFSELVVQYSTFMKASTESKKK